MEHKKESVNTPTAKKSLSNVPRTPTPFKNALNEIRKIHGRETYVPSSPNGLVEDITEIMNEEAQQDSTMESSAYDTDSRRHIGNDNETSTNTNTSVNTTSQNITNPKRLTYEEDDSQNQPQQQQKKAKKSLESSWSTAANTTANTMNSTMTTTTDDSEDFPYLVETPVRAFAYTSIYYPSIYPYLICSYQCSKFDCLFLFLLCTSAEQGT